jgi:hypothetical protein
MLSALVAFEWRYQTRQLTFLAAAVGFLGFGYALTASGFGPEAVRVHAPWLVTESLGFLALLSVFALAAFCGNALVRDAEHHMEEVLYSTPAGAWRLLGGRFLGAFLTALTAFAFALAGMGLASVMPWLDPARAGGPGLAAFAWALGVMALPTLLFCAALLFAIAAVTRSALACHVGAVAVYALYLVASALTESPLMAASRSGGAGLGWAAALDPFGLSAFFEQTRFWTVEEQNTRFVALTGTFLLNRLATLAAAAGLFLLAHRAFVARASSRARGKATRPAAEPELTPGPLALQAVSPAPRGAGAWLAAWRSATAVEARALLLSRAGWALLGIWAVLALEEVTSAVSSGEYGAATLPMTGIVLDAVRTPLALVGTLVLVYAAAEVAWRERRYAFADTVLATPAPSGALVAAKWSALSLLVLAMVGIGAGVALGVQVVRGGAVIEPGLYGSLFLLGAWPLLVLGAALLFVHVLSPARYAGLLVTAGLLLFSLRGGAIGFSHPLWRFGTVPPLSHSDLSGFGGGLFGACAFLVHWTLLAVLLAVLTAAAWRGGASARERWRALGGAFRGSRRAPLAALVGLVVLSAAFILYNTDVLNRRESPKALQDWKAEYERTYGALAAQPTPTPTRVEATVALEPAQGGLRLTGATTVVNRTGAPIQRVWVSVRRDTRVLGLSVDGAALERDDARLGMHGFRLSTPLAPGASTKVRYALSFAREGFTADSPDTRITDNGSVFLGFQWWPGVGFRRGWTLTDPRERARRGLPPADAAADAEDESATGTDWITFDVTVSTAPDQTVVGPGRLVRSWEEGGHRLFRYASEARVPNLLLFTSARYAVARREHHGVTVEVFHHPGHAANVERILGAATVALDVMQAAYGPYPHQALRIAEIPSTWPMGGFAFPGGFVLNEERAFLIDARDPRRVDLIARRVAHETAHQWWGYGVSPPSGPGATALVESLTKLAELRVLERLRGADQVAQVKLYELDRYLSGRANASSPEVPLARVRNDQPYLFYGKGTLVLEALRGLLGADRMDAVLRDFYRENAGPDGHATSAALFARLEAAAPEAARERVHAWLDEVVLYELKLTAATVRPLPGGRYEVTLEITAGMRKADARGHESEAPLDEPVPLAIYGEDGQALLQATRRLTSGVNQVRLVVDAKPSSAAVDPALTRIERDVSDNRRDL